MKVRFSRPRWKPGIVALFVTAIVGFGAIKWVEWSWQQRFDLGNKPPDEVFTRIFDAPVPSGVFNMKVAGEAHLSGVFWMRFQTHDMDNVLASLKRNSNAAIVGPTDVPDNPPSASQVTRNSYAGAVDWGKALQIQKPEYYRFPKQPSGTGWFGILIIDRTRNTIYVTGELL
jgi:hypothetical protein